jgi:uncharacterized protein YndB with AHSA1/START domain
MTNDSPQRDFTLTWMLDAPPPDVFRAWTDPDHLHWFYNDDNPMPTEPIEVDLRVGGAWRQQMVIDATTAYVTGGVYREIVPDEKLVFSWGATDGWPELDPERLDDSPLVTVTLTEVGGRTEITVRVDLPAGLSEDRVREWLAIGIQDGWRQTVDRLAAALESTAISAGT